MDVDRNGEVSQYEFADIFANSSFMQVVRAYDASLPDEGGIAPRRDRSGASISRVSGGSSLDVPT
jgi:hypothetical protein